MGIGYNPTDKPAKKGARMCAHGLFSDAGPELVNEVFKSVGLQWCYDTP